MSHSGWKPFLHPMKTYKMATSSISMSDLNKGWNRSWDCILHDGTNYLLVSMEGKRGQHHGWSWGLTALSNSPKAAMVWRMQEIVEAEKHDPEERHIRHIFMPWYSMDVLWVTNGMDSRFWVFKQKFKLDQGLEFMDVEMSTTEFMSFMEMLAKKQRWARLNMPQEKMSLRGRIRSWIYRIRDLFRSYLRP